MKCSCCNRTLSDYECSLKSVSTDAYMDTCVKCLTGLNIPTKGNGMLKKKLDEQEASFDEYDQDILYDDCLDDICIDYTLDNEEEDE